MRRFRKGRRKESILKRRRPKVLPKISAEEARQALHVLIAEGRIAAHEVSRALARREQLVRELKSRLSALGEDAAAFARAAQKELGPGTRRARRRARTAITEAQRIARRAQGQYLGAIRRLSRASRAKVREIRQKEGVKAAIAAARKLAG
jgi:hypothetical protein